MLPVSLLAAVVVLLVQPIDAKDQSHQLRERAAVLEARVISERDEADDESSSDTLDLKERVRLHGLPKTAGFLLYNLVATPFSWMWDVLFLPVNIVKTVLYAWNIHKEKKAESNS